MQTLAAIGNNSVLTQTISSGGGIGKLAARLFGCRHKNMSRPFSEQGHSHKTCLDCGASRRFNTGRWEMQGSYFYRAQAAGSGLRSDFGEPGAGSSRHCRG